MTTKKTTAVWLILWPSGYVEMNDHLPIYEGAEAPRAVGTTLIASVPIEAGVFADESIGKYEVYGESTEKLKALAAEVRRISVDYRVASDVYEALQEAAETYGPPNDV
jgi:hypothetical protein